MKNRQGVSLVETLVAMSALSIISTISVSTIFLLIKTEGTGIKTLVQSTNISRLTHDFRNNVHSAESAEIQNQNGASSLILMLPENRMISYSSGMHTVIRKSQIGNKTSAQEIYQLTEKEAVLRLSENRSLAAIILKNSGTESESIQSKSRSLHIEAAIGLDYRFSKQN